MDLRLGIVPIPVAVALALIICGFLLSGKLASDILVAIGLLGLGGFACAELGRLVPIVRRLGAPAIFATFLPSYLVYAHLLPAPLIKSVSEFTKASNFLYLFIAAVIVGSILSMDRTVLLRGFLRVFPTLFGGSIAGFAVGMAVGTALGIEPRHLFFIVLVPIMAGGVGEGAIPLSVGYAAQGSAGTLGLLLPSVMLASLTAILCAGALNMLGKYRADWTGPGLLAQGSDTLPESGQALPDPSTETIAAATMMIVTLYLAGALAQQLTGFPAPVGMLLLTVVVKLGRLASPTLEGGAAAVYRFFRAGVTYPLLFAIGIAMTPWQQILAALQPAMVLTIVATVVAIIGTGFILAPWFGMHRIDVAIVNACHSGQGGTGDVAILTAGDRVALMPFAQIATRIGGAITVSAALLLHARIGG
ncbi:2-hydroxycarboxylate transporter family protein [Sphingomonas nostoxanthinifaciens]|uniref:2-hydroxycarboxylate transporter family protein n=1 Tax=Sphingomonas nostoxanthinifaciens TaxID=2872652 RepID=UPI001CC216A3|nr:2-hydroxycarboxylate transporter family protein [Sphingomonas nostoxanthinifaciens]UAK23759.1 2-hydroxycarboxylate transporter family protein [Sphingomonas nostoxanthinifaciens]